MNILWLSWKDIENPESGGAELYSMQHAEFLTKQGHTVRWISNGFENSKKEANINGVTIERIGSKTLLFTGLFHLIIAVNYFFKWRNEFDIIIDESHFIPFATPLYSKVPVILLIHEVAGDIWKKTFGFPISVIGQYILEPLSLNLYKDRQIVTVSPSTKTELVKLGFTENKIEVIYNTILPISVKQEQKETRPTIIFLSSLRPMKGFDRVLEAYKIAKQKIPTLRLWVVGNDSTPYAEQIKQTMTTDQLTDSIVFFGKVSEEKKFELLQKAHILVHGSYKEGWGRVIIEANSVGTPSVVFTSPGLNDSVQHGKTGYIAKDENEFVSYLTTLLNDSTKLNQFSNVAIEYSKQFTGEQMKQKFLDLLISKTTAKGNNMVKDTN
jgi:glycosyltransferase involved in cell wall biosynthesis